MTKKRFVRLLMARHYQRNEAQRIAGEYRNYGNSYADAWSEIEPMTRAHAARYEIRMVFGDVYGALSDALIHIADALRCVMDGIRGAICGDDESEASGGK